MDTQNQQIQVLQSPFSLAAPALTLVKKLAEACDAVGGLEKKGRNKDQGYDYLKAADVAKAIRHELFSRGVVILPHETECVQSSFQTNKGTTAHEVKLTVVYHVTDGETTLQFTAYGIARDYSDKAVYKAKTGALKYFLRGLGLIPDEKDDPEKDSIESAGEEKNIETNEEFDQRTADQRAIAPFQITAIDEACKRTGKTEEEVLAYLNLIGHKRIEHILKSEFQEFLKWANTKTKASEAKAAVEKVARTIKPASQIVPDGRTKAMKRLWATAAELSIPEQDVKTCAYEKYQVDSMTKLNETQLTEMAQWVKEVAAVQQS